MIAVTAKALQQGPELRGVTLACIDTANHALALRALALSGRSLAFGRTLFLTDAVPRGVDVPPTIEVHASRHLRRATRIRASSSSRCSRTWKRRTCC
jgi:hypothetical protein